MPLDDVPPPSQKSETQALGLPERLFQTRETSRWIADPLSDEDQIVQAMEDASPTKWHLAHTTWFFEEMVLKPFDPSYEEFDARFNYCFNSYYELAGPRHPRPRRSLLTRPPIDEVKAYRAHIDQSLERFLGEHPSDEMPEARDLIELGIHHEQQHQELMFTDILAAFAGNPLRPVYRTPDGGSSSRTDVSDPGWTAFDGGIFTVGHDGDGFAYDNEGPRHEQLVRPFSLANRLVTNGEWLAFMDDGGYSTPTLWLSDGWATVQNEGWEVPLYWEQQDGRWHQMTLGGLLPVDPSRPVCHVSYYEADAFARWAGKRLPTEFEWEVAAKDRPIEGNLLNKKALRPEAARGSGEQLQQMIGDLWEWTASHYSPYPGFKPAAGAIGEYNGKFMCNQFVLRGGSCVTPDRHIRRSYRNFFYPHQRWQFAGLRLADDGGAA